MSPLFEVDRLLIETAPAVEHPLLTSLFVLLSAWWVKGPLVVLVGLVADARSRRRIPVAALAAGAAWLVASLVVIPLKELFGRARPPEAEPGLGSLVTLPDSASFPSGHSATAFATATAVAILCPRLRPAVLALAVGVALSRVYLRVHFPLDVLAGGLLGASVGALAALAALRLTGVARQRPA
jgi:undecaprenyl-diphosphatase